MSEEKNSNETVETQKKSSGWFGWAKNLVSAVIGAAISFGVTIGVVNADQAKQLNEKMSSINVKAEEVVTALKNKDVKVALEKAQAIATETKVVKEIATEIATDTKEKVTAKADELKKVATEAKKNIGEAAKTDSVKNTVTDIQKTSTTTVNDVKKATEEVKK